MASRRVSQNLVSRSFCGSPVWTELTLRSSLGVPQFLGVTQSPSAEPRTTFCAMAGKPGCPAPALLPRRRPLAKFCRSDLGLTPRSRNHERRLISDGPGIALPRKRRQWWKYIGAIVLGFSVGVAGFLELRKLYLKRRGVNIVHIPYLPFQFIYPFGAYKGIVINTAMLSSIEKAENFPVREDDIFVVSFPRSGTTWTQELVYLVAHDADVNKAYSQNLEARFPYLEDMDNSIESLHTAESPRFIKSHLPYRLLPKDIHTKKPKIIYIMRNPKDMVVSFFHLWKKLRVKYRGEFSDFCKLFLQDKLIFSPWTEHVKGFWERRHEDNILFLTYEDLYENLPQEVERISKFLNKPLSAEQISTIVDHCSFESMKKNDKVNYKWWDDRGITANIGTSFIRKGRVGDWKNFFTPDLETRLSEKIERPLAVMKLDVKFEVD